ncbi:MAG: glutamate 5-kinase [Gammaproteobacteria bacterium]|nr:glutamate 5-kinase [Gammaproteobacteria bacterium]
MSGARKHLSAARRLAIKLGSALLTRDGGGLREDSLAGWVAQIMALRARGIHSVIVSSGAVAEGVSRLGWNRRPHALHELQAAAAVGQMGLIQAYEACFQKYGVHTAQILLTHDDIADRRRYLNARSTLRTLIGLGVVPIINENDSVATEEIRLGDNDALGGLVANLVEADLLVILTDQAGLYDADPRANPDARLIPSARAGDPELERFAGRAGGLGRGGMLTKLRAAANAAKSGAHTVVAYGLEPDVLVRILDGEDIGTLLYAEQAPIAARKQWLASQAPAGGQLSLDAGAVRVLRGQGRSLLAVGVTAVHGDFRRGEVVSCVDPGGVEIARGLVNYSAEETRRIMGQPSDRIEQLLGYVDEEELIHRDNLVLV